MIGGAYLCFEGAEKVWEAASTRPRREEELAEEVADAEQPPIMSETMVAGAIRTDFILSAEIMAIALAEVGALAVRRGPAPVVILALVAVAITIGVYGVVGLIVKMDDIGLHLAERRRSAAPRALGRGLVHAMPKVMAALSLIGIAAMIWVGGRIIVHGLEASHAGRTCLHELAQRPAMRCRPSPAS